MIQPMDTQTMQIKNQRGLWLGIGLVLGINIAVACLIFGLMVLAFLSFFAPLEMVPGIIIGG